MTRAYPENIFGVPSWDPDYIDQRQAEFDPTGGNVGTISDYQPQYGTVNNDFLPIESESYLFIDGQRVAATLDGMAVSWHMLERMAAAGALTIGSNGGWQFPVEWRNGSIFVPRTYRADPANDYLPRTSSWWVVNVQTQQRTADQYEVDLALTGAIRRLSNSNCLREIRGLLNRAAERLFDDPTTTQNEYTTRSSDNSNVSMEDYFTREEFTARNFDKLAWEATTVLERSNFNITPGTESEGRFSLTRATAQGTTITFYAGFFNDVEQGSRSRQRNSSPLFQYVAGSVRTQFNREITALHELVHLIGNGQFSDELLGGLILNRKNVSKSEGSEALTAFLERHCR